MIEIGVDIGGTFTDVVCQAPGEPVRLMKLPTTRQDQSLAVIEAIRRMAADWGIAPEEVGRFVHGTTVATNAVLERKGPKIGILTTRGFKDVLEIGRQMRQRMYDVVLQPETPVFLAPGRMRREVTERLSAKGRVLTPLDEDSVSAAARGLVADGAEAIAICFLHSYLDPAHEQRAALIVRREHPELYVSLSCEVDPAFREYERTVVTAFDAYIKPVIDRYLERLEAGLRRAGVRAPLQIMQSRGGLAASAAARTRPVRLFLSGPAAGVIGGRMVGEEAGLADLITVDIGGTSCDIALVHSGKPLIRAEGLVDGFPIRVPMVDVNAIGAGGGSIAWIDSAGGLRVGPHSAGSEPGPACYGRGGADATVTDASVVLGYIDPAYFAGGTLRLDPTLAHATIEQRIAGPLGMSVREAALGIHRVLNAHMTEGIRLVSIRQGFDPRRFALVPLGGGGGMHACALAEELGITRILVPRHPGVLSAQGLLAARAEHEVSVAFPRPLAGLASADVRAALNGLDARGAELMAHEGGSGRTCIEYSADVCYIGQSHHLEVPLRIDAADPIGALYDEFVAAHDRVYGHSTRAPARIVNLRAVHSRGFGEGTGAVTSADRQAAREAVKSRRAIVLSGLADPVEVPVYDRARLGTDAAFAGPAIIEQPDTTTLVDRGWSVRITGGGHLLLTRS